MAREVPTLRSAVAKQGLRLLCLAVIDVLSEGQCLSPAEIRRTSGIDAGLGVNARGERWGQFMRTLLVHLEEQGCVERCVQQNGRPGWRAKAR